MEHSLNPEGIPGAGANHSQAHGSGAGHAGQAGHGHDAHGDHGSPSSTSTGLDSRKLAFWCYLGGECLFFGALIGTYMAYKGRSLPGTPTPDEILDIPLTSQSTFVLLASSFAMVMALDAIQKGNQRKGIWSGLVWLLLTAGLGTVFLGYQAYEFTHFYHEGLTLGTNLFGSSFFVLTGFHGFHVLLGVLWLLALAVLAARGTLTADKSLNVEIAGLYWHFVDIVWIIIFTLVYLLK